MNKFTAIAFLGGGVIFGGVALVFGAGMGAHRMHNIILNSDRENLERGWDYVLHDGHPAWLERKHTAPWGEFSQAMGWVNGSGVE